ncbi:hypothetical protein M153_208780001, partial [Pseudoloma neurophilia]
YKVEKELSIRMRIYFERNPVRLGGPCVIIQCDKTMLNQKIKAHIGRAPTQQIWAFAIVDTSFHDSAWIC